MILLQKGLVVVGPVNLLMGQSGPAKVLVVKKRMIRRALLSTALFPKILNRTNIEADSDDDVVDPDYQEPKKSKGPPPGSMGLARRSKRLNITH
jgi:hypothetical protein